MITLSEPMIRTFIAIDIEGETLNQILNFQKIILETDADLKIVEPENIHITLRFLGELPAYQVDNISDYLKTIHFNLFETSLQGIGVFPNMSRMNVIWVGIEKGILELVNIHSQIEAKIKKLGILPDDRGFNPHITIARVRSARNKNKLAEVIVNIQDRNFGTFSVESMKLKKSVLTPKGPIYTTLVDVKAKVK